MKFYSYFIKLIFFLLIFALFFGCQRTPNDAASAVASNQNLVAGNASNAQNSSLLVRSAHSINEAETKANQNNLTWQLVDGNVQSLDNLKGKAIVLDFWATYCPPCEEEIPHLVELSNRYQNQNFEVIGLHVGGPEDRANIAGFVRKYQMKYSLGFPDQDLMDFYLEGDARIPQTLVFDRQGQLIQKFVGFNPQIKTDLDAAVQKALEIQ